MQSAGGGVGDESRETPLPITEIVLPGVEVQNWPIIQRVGLDELPELILKLRLLYGEDESPVPETLTDLAIEVERLQGTLIIEYRDLT